MSALLSSYKACARFLSVRSGNLDVGIRLGLLGWCGGSKQSMQRLSPARCVSAFACAGNPALAQFVSSDKKLGHLDGKPHCNTRTRSFLGCGDGEEGGVLSKTHEERRVIGYSPEQLFSVVAAVDLYEDFVPWCQRSRVLRRYDNGAFDAELEIGFKLLVERYVSHVEMEKPKYIKTTASDSALFHHLVNIWEFNSGPVPGTCDLHFLVDFKFNSPLYSQISSMFFKEVVSRMVSSFTERCCKIYGPAKPVLESAYGQGREI